MNADVLTTKHQWIAVITLVAQNASTATRRWATRSPKRWRDSRATPTFALSSWLVAHPVIQRHFNIPALIQIAESLRAPVASGPENATYNGGFFRISLALCESLPKPVIAASPAQPSRCLRRFALSCDLRIAEDGGETT